MKIIICALALVISVTSCKEEAPKDYVSLSGTITSQNSDSLIIVKPRKGIIKTIKLNNDGTFSETLKVEDGTYMLIDGKERGTLFFKNGYDLNINLNAKEFDETLKFTGAGAEPNNYLVKKAMLEENIIDYESLMEMTKANFDKKLSSNSNQLKSLLKGTKNLDSLFISSQEKEIEGMTKQFSSMFDQKQILLALKGKKSPEFIDYENHKGGTTSLEDLKGKYVYVDVWATWCGPCKAEIPFLKEIEKKYHDKNIEFVSISVDKKKDYDKWKTMVVEKELGGIQLIADNDWKSKFVEDYKIKGIPRFLLIDPNGNIVSADAPRPSSDKLTDLLNELKI